MHISAKYGQEIAIEAFFRFFAKDDVKNSAGQTPLDLAKASGKSTLAGKWEEIKKNNAPRKTAMHTAAAAGDLTEMEKLKKDGLSFLQPDAVLTL